MSSSPSLLIRLSWWTLIGAACLSLAALVWWGFLKVTPVAEILIASSE